MATWYLLFLVYHCKSKQVTLKNAIIVTAPTLSTPFGYDETPQSASQCTENFIDMFCLLELGRPSFLEFEFLVHKRYR